MYYALKCKEYQSLFLDKQAFEKVKTQYPHANCKTFSSAKEGLDWIHDKNENIPSIQKQTKKNLHWIPIQWRFLQQSTFIS